MCFISAFQGVSYLISEKDSRRATQGKSQTTNVKGTDLKSMVGWGNMFNVGDDLNMVYLARKFIRAKQRKNAIYHL